MKRGDLVKFWFGSRLTGAEPKQVIGVIVRYNTWEKVCTVLYGEEFFRIRAENLQKAGKKDAIKQF